MMMDLPWVLLHLMLLRLALAGVDRVSVSFARLLACLS